VQDTTLIITDLTMEERDVGGVKTSLDPLQVITIQKYLDHVPMGLRELSPLEIWERRQLVGRPHIDPDHPTLLPGGIGLVTNLLFVGSSFWGIGHFQDLATYVILPAVVDAAQTLGLISSIEKRSASVRAILIDKANPPSLVAVGNQPLT